MFPLKIAYNTNKRQKYIAKRSMKKLLTKPYHAIKTQVAIFYRFIQFVIKNFMKDDCTYYSSALTFTALLAIVPLMSVSFSLLSSFPMFQELKTPIQDFIFENFVPTTGKVVQKYIMTFTAQASKLSISGVAFLFITSVLLMFTIEQALNKIWKVRVQRQGTSAFLLYWAILSLTPILMGLSFAASSYVFSLPFISPEAKSQGVMLLHLAPFLLTLTSLTFVYMVVPNCRVHFMHAFKGAFIASALFEAAKQAFTWYLSSYNSYELLYGAFAILPVFFLWVYYVWLIVLLGAEVAFALGTYHSRRPGKAIDPFTHAIHWLNYLWDAQRQGHGLSLEELINKDSWPYQLKPERLIAHLLANHFIKPLQSGKYILSRDLSNMQFQELKQLLPWALPSAEQIEAFKQDKKLIAVLSESEKTTQALYRFPVSDLFK